MPRALFLLFLLGCASAPVRRARDASDEYLRRLYPDIELRHYEIEAEEKPDSVCIHYVAKKLTGGGVIDICLDKSTDKVISANVQR